MFTELNISPVKRACGHRRSRLLDCRQPFPYWIVEGLPEVIRIGFKGFLGILE